MKSNKTIQAQKPINHQTNKPGYILVFTLVIMAIMMVMIYYSSTILFAETGIARNQKAASVSLNLAEAGLQEAMWRIQNDTTTKDAFVAGSANINITHPQALLTGGSYQFNILSTAPAAATITATGFDQFGARQAQRKISLNVIQTATAGAYSYDAALLVGGPNSGNAYIHNMNITYGTGFDPGGIVSAGSIDIGNANINVTKDILANGSISTHNSNVSYSGTEQANYPTAFTMPGIDVSSDNPNSYKSQAIGHNQYYTSAAFANLIKTKTTFNGIVYVAGSGGVTIKNKNLTFNGALISEGTITITNASLYVYHNPEPSGLITLGNLSVTNATLNIEGLVYIGVQSAVSTNANITVTGAILAHDFSGNNANLQLNFKKDWVSETLTGGGSGSTPIIKFQHWEEEY